MSSNNNNGKGYRNNNSKESMTGMNQVINNVRNKKQQKQIKVHTVY
jgi:hypothetical protein